MIQFGTVKYGIVKQLKDRARSERDIASDQEEDGTSLPCSPIAECGSVSPGLHDDNRNNGSGAEDHNHNNNITEDHAESAKVESNETYPNLNVDHQESLQSKRISSPNSPHQRVSSPLRQSQSEAQDEDEDMHKMSDTENENDLGVAEKEGNPDLAISSQHPLDAEDDSDQCKNAVTTALEMISRSTNSSPPSSMPQFPNPPMTLEAIQNMQIAIAQFAAKTLANGGADNEAAMKQLAFLQQTLFNLQQQQIFQLQLIQQLQSQLAMNQMKGEDNENNDDEEEDGESEECGTEEEERLQQNCLENNSNSRHHSHRSSTELGENEESQYKDGRNSSMDICRFEDDEKIEKEETHMDSEKSETTSSRINMPKDISAPLPKQDENTPLPFGSDLASSIITNHDNPPSLDEPNSLEMLQKRAQEVLESASQGILAGNLADEFAFGKDKAGDGKNRNEPFFKHRCRYCGKVFGSDSALQIHIRSHTGERPFKCNVCGSRFTTKGNLKVHFQRHAQKFPNVPMNSTPIPEHLDKFHPPLLEQMSPETSPQHQPSMPHVPNVPVTLPLPFPPGAGFPGLPLYRPPLEILKSLGPYPGPFFGALPPMPPKRDLEQPTDLRKPQAQPPSATSPKIKEEATEESKDFEPISLRIKEEKREREEAPSVSPKSPKSTTPPPPLPPSSSHHSTPLASAPSLLTSPLPESSMHSQQSPSLCSQTLQPPVSGPPPPSVLQQMHHLSMLSGSREAEFPDRSPLNFTKTSPERRSPIRSPVSIPRSPFLGPIKHEMALLPRPHSNDNSWENFIEVSNTSETVKLKELMKNKKITDPNQCVVCDRVLSCKSALQMHYRTHTGERPFKCRICGRAFTTKGNLKTHMAVHKIRPPMRNFHQCPVCHKKYSNALVLQQHIRLHTGEPTDLTPEQIQAAEIRDFPPTMVPGSFINPFTFNFGMPPQNGHMGSESSQGDNDDAMDCSDDFDDEDISDHMSNGGDSDRPKSRDEMKGMLEQKLKIESNRPKSEASTSSAPTSPVSAMNKCSPAPSDTSQGALDLTPRSSLPQPMPPNMLPNRPPFGMFPNLPIFPPVSSTAQNMCNAMNSIAQSVMPAAPFNPLALSGVRGSTTCGICFKTFPCHSALEIHYRSHTKERPFKCSICDRGFTTKGNLKQHMLTHKIRDMEQDAFRNRAVKYMSNWKEGFE
ncbi:unnamed protein product [Hermetia illucens]|uniref:Homeotic protein spalt-major n=2 Tax=Hermetia illucens TaxID=343691 RepID=A0A7R8YNC3_HERIL|nr:unnamed protein product [Hermetia illucens]